MRNRPYSHGVRVNRISIINGARLLIYPLGKLLNEIGNHFDWDGRDFSYVGTDRSNLFDRCARKI
jgi:hypothetical protein